MAVEAMQIPSATIMRVHDNILAMETAAMA
jgi:hypothetical protein